MAIIYPLNLPANNIKSASLSMINTIAETQSPFTGAINTYSFPKECWQIDITIAPTQRDQAELWIAWFAKLRGKLGTFLMGDPNGSAKLGTATTLQIVGAAGARTVTATLNSGSATLLAGTYFQVYLPATGLIDSTLHKVLVDRTGNGNLEIWPALRKARTASDTCIITNAKGLFRLSSNDRNFQINEINQYGMTFGAMEAIQ